MQISKQDIMNKMRDKYQEILKLEGKVYIFGTGLLGMFVQEQLEKNHIEIAGFIDNNPQKHNQNYGEYTVHALDQISKQDNIIIASIIYWHDMRLQMEEQGYTKFICYEELAFCDARFPVYNQSFQGMVDKLIENREEYLQIFEILEDEKSKEILDNIIKFRYSFDTCYTEKAYCLSKLSGNQYFDREIVYPSSNEIFVDGGGYNGDSAMEFIQWSKENYKKILFYELDDIMVGHAKKNLERYSNIEYMNVGLGKQKETLLYDGMNSGGGGIISEAGSMSVEVAALDEKNEAVTFIKLDIEGFEQEALAGASKTIKKHLPKLAISVYHKPEDLYAIAKYIRQLEPRYKFYLRHYSNVYADTVLYAIL